MARAPTMVQLSEELLAVLDEEATRRGMSRSELIREALAGHLVKARRAASDRQIVAGYERLPPATPDGWAPIEGLGDVAAGELLERLGEEERRAYLEPW